MTENNNYITSLSFDYSMRNGKVVFVGKYWFIRVCDLWGYELGIAEVVEHNLLLPRGRCKKVKNMSILAKKELLEIEDRLSEEGYYIMVKPKSKKIIPSPYFKDLLLIK